ncbi:hypothetical protein [Cellulomonas dongxiuzhuiae]|uniref:hypothetical protein n=1 Tax=Cellulomonas dongxiuzhuiae TaxID=2819979 RepID=UPI001AAE592B|nr:hypothetical protein [Cellulomonas dongxiuzhuiae]MBO3088276.1 hypothetical protein [Cellulomonas dongxiuzhuiae]
MNVNAPELDDRAVLELISAHARRRPPRGIVFEVTEAVFAEFRAQQPRVRETDPDEIAEINSLLGTHFEPDDLFLSGAPVCDICTRALSMVDVVRSGLDRHGEDFVRSALLGPSFIIQIAAPESALDVVCPTCGNVNKLPQGADPLSGSDGGTAHTYFGAKYGYA